MSETRPDIALLCARYRRRSARFAMLAIISAAGFIMMDRLAAGNAPGSSREMFIHEGRSMFRSRRTVPAAWWPMDNYLCVTLSSDCSVSIGLDLNAHFALTPHCAITTEIAPPKDGLSRSVELPQRAIGEDTDAARTASEPPAAQSAHEYRLLASAYCDPIPRNRGLWWPAIRSVDRTLVVHKWKFNDCPTLDELKVTNQQIVNAYRHSMAGCTAPGTPLDAAYLASLTSTPTIDSSVNTAALLKDAFMVALLFVLARCSFGLVVALPRWLIARSRMRLVHCHRCGYDLRGIVGYVCPECGTTRTTPLPPARRFRYRCTRINRT